MANLDYQNTMPVYQGMAPGIDAKNRISKMHWTPNVVAKTADYTVLAKDSGTIFVTEGATAAVNFTLPAASDGPWVFEFFAAEDVDMTITAETVDTMVTFNDVAADSIAVSTSSEKIGGSFRVFSAGGSVVYVQSLGYGGHLQTVTIVTA